MTNPRARPAAALDPRAAKRLSANVERAVRLFLRHHRLRGPLLVAVSGGPDSVCLLHALVRLRPSLGLILHAAHLDHQLRGAASAADASYVARLCRTLGVPLTSGRADVAAYRQRKKLSPEDAARRVRYGFLAAIARHEGSPAVLLGHTADDQAETVLLHLIRGAGLAGLRGMDPVSRWPIAGESEALILARPLLGVSRADTHAYCAANRLRPRHDPTNRSRAMTRNRVRRDILPALRKLNPRVDHALVRLARAAADADAYLEQEAARAWPRVARLQSGAAEIRSDRYAVLAPALRIALLRHAVAHITGAAHDIEEDHLRRMDRAALGPAGATVPLPGGLLFSTGYASHRLGLAQPPTAPPATLPATLAEKTWPLTIPGVTAIPGWRIHAAIVPPPRRLPPPSSRTIYLPAALAPAGLLLRSRRPGDRFHPPGMAHAKKLQDILVNAKVPRPQRDDLPLLCTGRGEILWIVGLRPSRHAALPARPPSLLRLQFSPR
ncbi:MAG: tRNA lysidine(34) synthetase TilS [Dehalococcoidia bacterium]|nr:tRNA lysidine(34) synthetase TilS [Dehalococcoidia bacterium]